MTDIVIYAIIGLIALIIIVIFMSDHTEYFTQTTTSNEALQNLSSLYNNGQVTATNITATGAIIGGSVSSVGVLSARTINGFGTNAQITKGSASPDAVNFAYGDGTGWRANFGKSGSPTMQVYDNGAVNIIGNTSIGGNLNVAGMPWQPQYFMLWSSYDNSSGGVNAFASTTSPPVPTICAYDDGAGNLKTGATCNNTDPSQLFYWNGNRIVNKKSGNCVQHMAGWSVPNGWSISTGTCNNSPGQMWFRSVNNGWKIKNFATQRNIRINKSANSGGKSLADGWDDSCGSDCDLHESM